MPSVMIPPGKTSAHPCPCGCVECAASSCELECLEQPRFFCGQLLTDQDLTALLDWTKDKFRLGRFRHGWGIACGLEVAADVEHAKRAGGRTSRISIGPGYAVGCCGDDLVLCQAETLDLSQAFESGQHQCEQPRAPKEDEQTVWNIGGLEIPRGELRVVDVFLRYQEELTSLQPALARGTNGQQSACDYSRAREIAKLDWECAKDPEVTTTLEKEARAWLETYGAPATLIDDYEKLPADERTNWLRERLNTPHFRFVRDLAETKTRDEVRYDEPPVNHPTLLFWLVQEQRNALLLPNNCPACDDQRGVPLARVWLRAVYDENRRRTIDVLLIDTARPYRRPLSKTTLRWPAPLGQINLAQFIWQRPEEALAGLGAYNISVKQEAWSIVDLANLKSMFRSNIFAPYDGNVTMRVIDTGMIGQRVVGFAV